MTSKDTGGQVVTMDSDIKEWYRLAQPIANDPQQWFDRDLDDYLFERQRNKGESQEYKDEEEKELKRIVELHDKIHYQLDRLFEDIVKWRFNVFHYHEMTQDFMMVHFTLKIFQWYGIINKFQIPVSCVVQFTKIIQKGYNPKNPYHNALHAIDVGHKMNYLIRTKMIDYLSDLQIMAAMIACIIHDFQHPGVTNRFLIRTRHSKAIRYNDKSVLENHHCAAAFSVMLEKSDTDITQFLTEDQFWVFRGIIIKMVLSTDLVNLTEVLGKFKTKSVKDNFPDDEDDKQMSLEASLVLADHANPLQPQDLYIHWFSLMMEEFYLQGDLERSKRMPLSNIFYDRTTTNPYQIQLGYIKVIVEPLTNAWITWWPDFKEDLVTKGLDLNKEYLKQKNEEAMAVLEQRGIVPIFRQLSLGTRATEDVNNLKK